MACLEEVNSFLGKFYTVWRSGRDASLFLESHAGQACVSLRVGLGFYHEHKEQPNFKKKTMSPCKKRRRERRAAAAAAKLVVSDTEQASDTLCDESDNNDTANHECVAIEETVCVDDTSEGLSIHESTVADEAVCLEDKDENCDVYVFTYWDTQKTSDLKEAVGYIGGALTNSLEFHNVTVADRSFRIATVRKMEDNEVEVHVKIKKNVRLIDTSARRIQTPYKVENLIYISLKRIIR